MSALYASITGVSDLESVTITNSHDSSTATALIVCGSHTLDLGSSITINMGYVSGHALLFTGFVKQISRSVPDTLWTIQCNDVMTQAIDFFIASTDPNDPLTYQNIAAETLVGNLLTLANLTSYSFDSTSFVFGVLDKFEINLVTVHDYCRRIADLLTWNLYADQGGTIHFKNRKPYVMTGTSGQPHDVADTPDGNTITDDEILVVSRSMDTQKLRNKVIVYGNGDVHAEASSSSPYLPSGFYKTAVLAAPGLIDDTAIAQATADYNLNLLNRLTEGVSVQIVGNTSYEARTTTMFSSSQMGISSSEWYIYTCQHVLSRSSGYVTNLELRK